MKRRNFLGAAGAGLVVAGCGQEQAGSGTAVTEKQQTFDWKMVTTWPKNFPGLGTGANNVARLITEMRGGRSNVAVYG